MTGSEKCLQVRLHTPDEALLCQLAEEAAELAQAALKMRRVIKMDSPTGLDLTSAKYNLLEELSDVTLCAKVLDIQPEMSIMNSKLDRWLERLGFNKESIHGQQT